MSKTSDEKNSANDSLYKLEQSKSQTPQENKLMCHAYEIRTVIYIIY